MKKFIDGCIFGFGFSIVALVTVWAFFSMIELYDKNFNNAADYHVRITDFKEIKVTHRFIPFTKNTKGGLVISGEVILGTKPHSYIEAKAIVRNSEGGLVQICDTDTVSDIDQNEVLEFSMICDQVVKDNDFSTYKLEFYGSPKFPYER